MFGSFPYGRNGITERCNEKKQKKRGGEGVQGGRTLLKWGRFKKKGTNLACKRKTALIKQTRAGGGSKRKKKESCKQKKFSTRLTGREKKEKRTLWGVESFFLIAPIVSPKIGSKGMEKKRGIVNLMEGRESCRDGPHRV